MRFTFVEHLLNTDRALLRLEDGKIAYMAYQQLRMICDFIKVGDSGDFIQKANHHPKFVVDSVELDDTILLLTYDKDNINE